MWDTKYRPLRFCDTVGQDTLVAVLKSRIRARTAFDRSYLFFGGSGTGKTTLARILARAMLCEQLDTTSLEPCNVCDACQSILTETSQVYVERDAASQSTVDSMRSLIEDLPFSVFGAPKRIYCLDEAHRLSSAAQDIILKPIEEKRLTAILCTTEPENIKGTIRSRCEEYGVRPATSEQIVDRLCWILQQEGVSYDRNAVMLVVDRCGYHIRTAITRLETISLSGAITVDSVSDSLDLGSTSKYLQIVKFIKTPSEYLKVLEDLLCKHTAEEVAGGLSDAALVAFRVGKGFNHKLSAAETMLAKEVYDQHGVLCLQISQTLVTLRRPSRSLLEITLLLLGERLSGTLSELPALVPSVPSTAVAVSSDLASKKEADLKKPEVPKKQDPDKPDPFQLTELDKHVLSNLKPATSKIKLMTREQLSFNKSEEDRDLDILTPDQWRIEFERSFLRYVNKP